MKKKNWILLLTILFATIALGACHRKNGCPSNGKNVGAERIMSGEKVPRARKFSS